jgi:hypothetical protein
MNILRSSFPDFKAFLIPVLVELKTLHPSPNDPKAHDNAVITQLVPSLSPLLSLGLVHHASHVAGFPGCREEAQ